MSLRAKEKKESVEFHNIVVFDGLGELALKYLHKGERAFVEGRIRMKQWEDKNGQRRYRIEIIADNLIMLGNGMGRRAESSVKEFLKKKYSPKHQSESQ